MGFQNKGKSNEDFDNPHIPEDYYWGSVKDIKHYDKEYEDGVSHKVIMTFEIEHEGDTYDIPYFAPANISITKGDGMSSDLATDLKKLGLLEVAAKAAAEVEGAGKDVAQAVVDGDTKYCIEDEDDVDNFIDVLNIVFDGKQIRVNVADMNDGESSVVQKFSDYKAKEA